MSGDQWVNGGCRSVSSARKPDLIVDRRLVAFLEPPRKPARGDAGMPPRILDGDQGGELQRLGERDAADLAQRVLGDEKVPAVNRSSKDRPWMSLRARACLS